MNRLLIFYLFLLPKLSSAQTITISGYIKDARSGEALSGATIFNTNQKTGTLSNNYGFYSLTIKKTDTVGLVFSYQGYQPQIKKAIIENKLVLNINMVDNSSLLSEVIVSASRSDKNVSLPKWELLMSR